MDDLQSLGHHTEYPTNYDPNVLETFENRHPDNDYWVKFNCPEFTSLCPITGQPDFASIYISYVPDKKMVESKSLKLYLFSYRNHGDFHENCVNTIMKDLIKLMSPKYIEVWGKFMPRGGISIDPYCNYGQEGTKYANLAPVLPGGQIESARRIQIRKPAFLRMRVEYRMSLARQSEPSSSAICFALSPTSSRELPCTIAKRLNRHSGG